MINWGIMATETIAHRFADTIVDMKGEGRIIACGSRSIENSKKFAEEYNIPHFYGSYEELINDSEVDVIYIATPNSVHYENIKQCIMAGKHILCEKPFTLNAELAEEVFALARERNVFLMEAFWISMLPGHLKVQELLADNVIGDVRYIKASYGYTTQEVRKKFKFNPELGGGALMDIGVYNIGFISMLINEIPTNVKSSVHMNDFGTDDFETIIFDYHSDATAVLTVSIGMSLGKEACIYGKNGNIYLPDFQKAEKIVIQRNDGTSEEINMPFKYSGFEYQIEEVQNCIKQGKITSDIQTPEKTINVLKIMDSLRKQWGLKFPAE